VALRTRDPQELFDLACSGDRGALARLLSMVERSDEESRAVSRIAYPKSGKAYTVGLTGAPGAGKSTLTAATIGVLVTFHGRRNSW
jgi:LAO/AO transport system kinase